MKLAPVMEGRVAVGLPQEVGEGPRGLRMVFPLEGGSFEGHHDGRRFSGEVLPGGADWALLRPDRLTAADIRLTLRTRDEVPALIYASVAGLLEANEKVTQPGRDALEYGDTYFVSHPHLETGHPDYVWMSRAMWAGEARLGPVHAGTPWAQWIGFRWYLLLS
jgi:hypothetical protein